MLPCVVFIKSHPSVYVWGELSPKCFHDINVYTVAMYTLGIYIFIVFKHFCPQFNLCKKTNITLYGNV